MYALQCRLPSEAAWTDIFYDTLSQTQEDADKRLGKKKKFIKDNNLLAPETQFQIVKTG